MAILDKIKEANPGIDDRTARAIRSAMMGAVTLYEASASIGMDAGEFAVLYDKVRPAFVEKKIWKYEIPFGVLVSVEAQFDWELTQEELLNYICSVNAEESIGAIERIKTAIKTGNYYKSTSQVVSKGS